jgi:hypothetical protein
MGPVQSVICPNPHKLVFTNKGEAKTYLKANADYYSKQAPKIYIYHCECGNFHFSKSQRGYGVNRALPPLVYQQKFQSLIKK